MLLKNFMNYQIDKIINEKKNELEAAFHAINQARSNYQIQHFVVGQHDTEPRQYSQCVLELQVRTFNLRRQMVEKKKLLKKISATTDADEKELLGIDLEEMELGLENQVREWNVLYQIFSSMPKYTYEQIQSGEEEYWQLRLARQSQEEILAHGRIGVGNLDALWQSKAIDNPAIAFIEQHKKPELPE
jgi:hypothetical protein